MHEVTQVAALPPTPADQHPRRATAQTRASFPRVVLNEKALPEGAYLVQYEEPGNLYRITWDPAQTTRAKVEIWINIYIAGSGEYVEYTPAVYRALRALNQWRQAGGLDDNNRPEVVEFWDTVEQAVIASNDPVAAVRIISDRISAEFAENQLAEVTRIAESLGAEVIEFDPAEAPSAGITHGCFTADPTPVLYFPAGQKPGERLSAARQIMQGLATA